MAKIFTLEEASALLPRLRELLARTAGPRTEMERALRGLRDLQWKARGNGHEADDQVLGQLQEQRDSALADLNNIIGEIRGLGVEVKDLEQGLVDFPTMREGRSAYLCWKLDETEISYWHPVETGFDGRQPL